MKKMIRVGQSSMLLTLLAFASGCVVAPQEGYYDHDHHRYYHEHAWHECGERNDFCR